jgi:2-succinyl-5-enolpyruvyl-6-hydroxy-3-cyclohexene-1-carboxylate synthase
MASPPLAATSPAGDPHAPARANLRFAAALLGELAAGGVRDVCVCPGSRSTPLAVAAARTAGLRLSVHVDERSAAFFALGLARARRAPVALVCTSGTAAANFLPAVVEAHHARIGLVVLTADRPHELRGWGAPQTVDQIHLYGSQVRWFAELPAPAGGPAAERHARMLGARATALAAGPPAGPVHLNLAFREPLEPPPLEGCGAWPDEAPRPPAPRRLAAARSPGADLVAQLEDWLREARRGVIACGPLDASPDLADAVGELARLLGWPVLADALSGLRGGGHVEGAPLLAAGDALLRTPSFAERHAPDLVLRLGAPPTSKAFSTWLGAHAAARLVLLDPDGAWADPQHRAEAVVEADPLLLVTALLRRLRARPVRSAENAWLRGFLDAESKAQRAIDSVLAEEAALFGPRVVRELADALARVPAGAGGGSRRRAQRGEAGRVGPEATLFVSNSMAVRDADGFLPLSSRPLRVLGNRGANGIDGIVSTALGVSAAGPGPCVLLSGDLAVVHDLGALVTARRAGLDLVVVVLHDDGGGIFHHLPVAARGEEVRFEELFAVPHGTDFVATARALGLEAERVASVSALRRALEGSLAARGTRLLEVRMDRHEGAAHHRRLWAAVREALGEGLAPRRVRGGARS